MQKLTTHDSLLAILQIDGTELRRMVEVRETYYSRHIIKRRSRSRPREVYSVRDGLRRVHRLIAVMLRDDLAKMGNCVHGFRKRKSIRTHAAPHCGARFVAVADISTFFASITQDRVWDLFLRLGASENVAMTLSRLTTLNGFLPEGPRSSPAIANLIGEELDEIVLRELPAGCSYTRYADDLAFSGDVVPSEDDVARWASAARFRLKANSYRMRHRSQGPYVTGLFVGTDHPKVPRKRRRMVERTLYYLAKADQDQALMRMREGEHWRTRSDASRREGLRSTIESIGAIDPQLAKRYRDQLGVVLRGQ
jgi:RNA-directed DNA polymerase